MNASKNVGTIKNGAMLSSAIAAEKSMADAEAKDEIAALEESLPDGHPLKQEIERVKGMVGGDLSLIPRGHPIRFMIERFGAKGAGKTVVATRAERVKQSEDGARKREDYKRAVKDINMTMSKAFEAMNSVVSVMDANAAVLADSPHRVKVMRLKRSLAAMMRALSDLRLI